jgi:RNA polymerase sigma-70 factor (sigma-E family)
LAGDEATFREFAQARMGPLHRTAYLLCGDWHTADDLVSSALVRLYRHWRRVSAMENIDAYARRTLLNLWLDERRRPWRREHPGYVPDREVPVADTAQRVALMAYLAELPPRRRAVLVLRYFCDLSVEETAEALGCSAGTVKSQTSRALDALRQRMGGDSGRAGTPAGRREETPLWT